MDNDLKKATITVTGKIGEQTTANGKAYWQVVDEKEHKWRIWSQEIFDTLRPNFEYDVSYSEYKAGNMKYPMRSIVSVDSVPLEKTEPLDEVLLKNPLPQKPLTEKAEQKDDKPDWDAIARGKVRNSVACAVLGQQGLVELTDEMIELMEQYVDYIMEGKNE